MFYIQKGEIYIIKNNINNNVYIGQTISGYKKRFKEHIRCAKRGNSKQTIHHAMIKHGIENFYIELLEGNIEQDVLNEREEYWIKFYDSFKNGYNMMAGGNQSRVPEHPFLVEHEKEIVEKYLSKEYSLRKLAEEYKVDRAALSNFLKKRNIEVLKRSHSTIYLTEQQKAEISNFCRSGIRAAEIAEKFGITQKTVYEYRDYNNCCA